MSNIHKPNSSMNNCIIFKDKINLQGAKFIFGDDGISIKK